MLRLIIDKGGLKVNYKIVLALLIITFLSTGCSNESENHQTSSVAKLLDKKGKYKEGSCKGLTPHECFWQPGFVKSSGKEW